MRNEMAAILALIALLAAGCGRKAEPAAETAAERADVVSLDQPALAAAGVQLETATLRDCDEPVRCGGTAVIDPRRLVQVTPVVSGKIESVSAFAGDRVRAGQPLAVLYCPELTAAQAEYLQIQAGLERRPADAQSERLLAAAEERLRLIGMNAAAIDQLRSKRTPLQLLELRAPAGGTVLESAAVPGAWREANRSLYVIADLSRLLVEAAVPEREIGRLSAGARAELQFSAFPGVTFSGSLRRTGDRLEPETRTLTVQIEVDNSGLRLKPQMYAAVTLRRSEPLRLLSVSEGAVRRIEGRPVVFVPGAAGEFLMRPVQTGRSWAGFVEILSGLAAGERLAGAGSFILKSELLKKNLEGE